MSRHVVAITGASGMPYAVRLLEVLDNPIVLISNEAKDMITSETGKDLDHIRSMAGELYFEDQHDAPPASGSFRHDGMVIVPASMNTVGKIASGIMDDLITRSAGVALKERFPFVIVPRETPMSYISLKGLAKLAKAGAIILPAMPAFYNEPRSIDDLVDFIVGRILDSLGVENDIYRRWEQVRSR